MNNKNIRNTWDTFMKDYKQYFISNEELWTNNLTKLKRFIDLNKRKPKDTKNIEKMLGRWLATQLKHRKTEKKIMLNKDIRNVWDIFVKDYNQYFLSNKELWTNNLTKLKGFIDLNKRRPNDKKETEKLLSMWLSTQLKHRKIEKYIMLNENTRDVWDSFIKDYNQYFLSNEELWTNNLTELKTFIDLNKRKPYKKINTEKMLNIWLTTQLKQRKIEKYIMLNENIKNTWDDFIKDYNKYFD